MSEEEKKKRRVGSKGNWYEGSVEYWDSRPATVDGVLGGFEVVHHTDSDTSKRMIEEQKHAISGFDDALDCGAGIGRISKETLKPFFANVDLLEPS
jgi:protein N-terminal methyltransferase